MIQPPAQSETFSDEQAVFQTENTDAGKGVITELLQSRNKRHKKAAKLSIYCL